jgi:epoxyqueuosine reductase
LVVGADERAGIVKARAADLGFRPVGITTADAFDTDLERALDWLEHGRQAGMGWLTPTRARLACDPRQLLDGAQSLIVVGAPYAHPDDEPGHGQTHGTIARYARGADYHDVMKARLTGLAETVRALGGDDCRTRIFVDSSPLVERAAAARAGLGFIGKNTNLLTREAGSFLLLGALLTTLELTPDQPTLRDCGRCRLCLDACPTGALPQPFVLDANRCISYLTIEHRGSIAPELRAQIGDLVFGCDICQDVCPWNRGQRPPGWPEFAGDDAAGHPPLAGLLGLDDVSFRARYRRTPLADEAPRPGPQRRRRTGERRHRERPAGPRDCPPRFGAAGPRARRLGHRTARPARGRRRPRHGTRVLARRAECRAGHRRAGGSGAGPGVADSPC